MNREQWIEGRKKYIGGSDIPAVMGISPYKSKRQLWLEKTGREKAKDISSLGHVMFGVHMESVIREYVESKTGEDFTPCFSQHPEYEFVAANLDGLSIEGNVLEIKTVGREVHDLALSGKLPDYYMAQLQWNMLCAGKQKGIYASYCKAVDEYVVIHVKEDKEYQREMLEAATVFWKHVTNDTDPSGASELLKKQLTEWSICKANFEKAKAEFEIIDEQVKDEFQRLDLLDVDCDGFKLTRVERKGNVDFKKIPELKGVDLEPYRGNSSTYVKITERG